MIRVKVKGLIAIGLVLAVLSTGTIPTVTQAMNISEVEYTTMFKEDARATSSYEQLRAKWVELITGNSLSGLGDEDVAKNIEKMDEKVKESIDNADTDSATQYVWTSLVDNGSKSATITAQFKRLKEICIAYKTKDSKYYNNAELLNIILKGTDKMYTKHYNEGITSMPNNWWDWQIGTPREVVDIMVLMDDELGELKGKLTKTIDRFIPDATKRLGQSATFKETGANLLDKALIVVIRGISEGNNERVQHGATVVQEVFPYVTKGDGFYTDGSFLQHGDIAYTGSYGAVLLNSLSNLLYIVQDTDYKIDNKDYYNLFRWMKDSYEPVMAIGGNIMDNVRGRAISRIAQQGDARGKFIISSMLRVAEIAPNKEAENYINSITKRWISEGSKASADYFVGLSTGDIAKMKNVLNDTSISQSAERNYYKQFYYMDRAVSNRPDYNFSVSMSSNRIANHEDINGESTKAWYTGQGMTQIYTNDHQQYNEDFWPTVDPFRLPGVTSDGQTRKFSDKSNSSAWAGGTTIDGVNGVSGMEILPTYRTVDGKASGMSARKSWFMFENEIVAVGSNISSTDKDVETIIDNRKIKDSADNKLIVNGQSSTNNAGDEETVKASWAHLEGNVSNSDIGYIFPKETEITTKRETRTNKWSDINTKAEFTNTEDKTRSYVSLAIDHGNTPVGGSYEYVMLPNATSEETAKYSENQPVKILINTDQVHAVYHSEEKIYAINVFEAGKITDNIEVDAPVSLMIKEENGGYKVAVSNPTKSVGEVKFTLKGENLGDFNITGDGVVANSIISIDTSSKSGETYEFNIKPKYIEAESITLDKTELDMKVGETGILKAVVNPNNSTTKDITWTSSNEEVVKVDSSGNVEAIGEGEATIKALVDAKEATCVVKVNREDIVEPEEDADTKPGTEEDDKNTSTDTSVDSGTKIPSTGDSSSLALLGLSFVASAGGLTILKNKKRKLEK